VTAEIRIFSERDTLVELLTFMQGNGWALYDITNLAYYPSDSTLYQCYATFIPKIDGLPQGHDMGAARTGAVGSGPVRVRRTNNLKALEELLQRG
jgi:hypothetical protein